MQSYYLKLVVSSLRIFDENFSGLLFSIKNYGGSKGLTGLKGDLGTHCFVLTLRWP